MIKKLGNTKLFLILIAVAAVFGIFRYISSKKNENTFQTALIPKIDSAKLNGIVIFPKKLESGPKGIVHADRLLPYVFTRKGKEWYVTQGDVASRAEPRSSHYLISQMEAISPDRLGSNDPKDWKQYNVTDSLGTRVVFLYDKDTVLDVIVGRFSYIPSQKQAISYLRIAGQKEVYAVDGFLSMNISEEFENWRDKKIMPGEGTNWKKLTFTYPADSGFVLKRDSGERWVFGDGSAPDSATTAKAIQDISGQNYGTFINKFDTNGKQPLFTLRVEGSDFAPTLIKAYPADTANIYAINSTLNPGSFFSGKGNGEFSKIFRSKSSFYPKGSLRDKKEDKGIAKKGKK
jgi:hypothetical protein